MGARRAAGDMADMELDVAAPVAVRHVGHRIVARRQSGEGHRGVLAGGEGEGAAVLDGEAHQLDVVGQVVQRRDRAGEVAQGMHDNVVGIEPAELGVAPRHRAAGQHQALGLLLVGQRVAGIGRQLNLAAIEPRLAGAAIAALTAIGVGHALGHGRVQHGLAGLDRDRGRPLADRDGETHGGGRSGGWYAKLFDYPTNMSKGLRRGKIPAAGPATCPRK
jgi:hypothetical protein